MAYAIAKRFTRDRETRSDEVRRIHERWSAANVSACRYCGCPLILHDRAYCEQTQAQIAEEEQ